MVTFCLRQRCHLVRFQLRQCGHVAKHPIELTVESVMDVPTSTGVVAVEPHPPFTWLNDIRPFAKNVYIDSATDPAIQIAGAIAKGPSDKLSIAAAHAFLFADDHATRPRVHTEGGGLTFTRTI